ncbi:MAG TPA: ferredoxin [Kiritimatiellia bacterium]|jgi:ferredoxin|nr:ferredoxin [Lentisphaerota bacterium]HRV31719.1 ferredoxin [Kiritimatiellia bacterium]
MKANVDANTCTGCTLCVDIAPDVFEMGDDGLARPKGDAVPAGAEASAEEAAGSCPVSAISIS